MSDKSERQEDYADRVAMAARAAERVMPPDAIQVLADEVVIRLASRLRGGEAAPRLDVSIDALCDALLSKDASVAQRIIDQERSDGVSLEVLYLHSLAGAARALGKRWEDDKVSFLSMTVAVGRIFEIMRGLRQEVPMPATGKDRHRRAFFASVPGEDHTIGVTMAAALLRNNGWQIELRTGLDHDALIEEIAQDDQDLIGLSAGRAEAVVPLIRLVLALRIIKPHAHILVCGRIVDEVRGLVDLVHADGAIHNDEDAVKVLESYLDAPAG